MLVSALLCSICKCRPRGLTFLPCGHAISCQRCYVDITHIAKKNNLLTEYNKNLVNIKKFINEISPSGIILSGGGDPRVKNLRYQTEKKLIKISLKKDIPTIGLCRGAQAINLFFGGKLLKESDILTDKDILKDIPKGFKNDYGWYGVG